MEITKNLDSGKVILSLKGRLDTVTSPELDRVMKETFEETNDLVLDLKGLDYVSSSGLRLFLIGYKTMSGKGGRFSLINVNEVVMDVLEMTGFNDLLSNN